MDKEVKKYWDLSSEGYNDGVCAEYTDKKQFGYWFGAIESIFGKNKGLDVLDIGTGPGFLATVLSSLGHKASGVDFSEEMLKYARENAINQKHDIHFFSGDACNLHSIEDNALDGVISRNVIWALDDPLVAFKEWNRIVKPGGKVVVICGKHNASGIHGLRKLWRFLNWRIVYLTEGDKPWKSPHSLMDDSVHVLPLKDKDRPYEDIQLLKQAGLNVVEVRRNIQKDFRTLASWLKQGYWGETFMIIAEKEIDIN
jgi:SAM-dependent methyltransferase